MLSITSFYASLLAILIIYLGLKVVLFRRETKTGLGDKGNLSGMKLIRAHANAIENIPMLVILMALYEINGGIDWVLHTIGIAILVARILHALYLSRHGGISFGRFSGTLITWISVLTLAGLNIYHYLS